MERSRLRSEWLELGVCGCACGIAVAKACRGNSLSDRALEGEFKAVSNLNFFALLNL